MRTETPIPIKLDDYRPAAWLVDRVGLDVSLEPHETIVASRLELRPNIEASARPAQLWLDGEHLKLLEVKLDGQALAAGDFELGGTGLSIPGVPDRPFVLEVTTSCNPQDNKALTGLYRSNGIYCTQCEAEGFRRITFFPDRPDVLARYRVRIEADSAAAPVLLSNGNLVETGSAGDGRHFAVWEDPFPKPSYLFAMVAGDLAMVEDEFVTRSGRRVNLRIYVEHGKEDRCGWAMQCLKTSMRWDEEAFGREYDLYVFMIVAVSDFNMGAMENKGLNVFNDKYILARPDTATDQDYANIEAIIAHEYFHNWTGNRITCRDWFQLCLKEGLTVYRDQEFTADVRSRAVKRIADVKTLRAQQFPEDAGPLAHPVRPSSYVEINNFYTATVYEKGAEIVRMLRTLLGEAAFRRAMDLYFDRHDGQAVTMEDFVACMSEASGRDLIQFFRWYEQAGTPEVTADEKWDGNSGTYELKLTQKTRQVAGQPEPRPLHIPLAIGLVGPNGRDLPLNLEDRGALNEPVVELVEASQTFRFCNLPERPVASLNRGFSAPVRLTAGLSKPDQLFIVAADSDPFNRWETSQDLARDVMLETMRALEQGGSVAEPDEFARAIGATLDDDRIEPAFQALMLAPPSESDIAAEIGSNVDPDLIHEAREALKASLGRALSERLERIWKQGGEDAVEYSPDAESAGRRALRHAALGLMAAADPAAGARRAFEHFRDARHMTDTIGALAVLTGLDRPERHEALEAFHEANRDDSLIVDKWLALNAQVPLGATVERVRDLMEHAAFDLKRPNRVRALIGTFANANPVAFNRADGAGYRLLAEVVVALDAFNPQVAARLATAFRSWRMLEPKRQGLAREALEQVAGEPKLSRDTSEIVTRCLSAQ
jgi:aminopeptidase N